ncbi:MAG: NUDIX domain-containing protein [Actinobacteria bacterium]|nr:NUDIX domain-containing protein [Actinomycetota bacterium]
MGDRDSPPGSEAPTPADRPRVYGIALRRGLVLVVRTPSGTYLPGGLLRPGEDPIEGLRRRVREETGRTVSGATPLADAGADAGATPLADDAATDAADPGVAGGAGAGGAGAAAGAARGQGPEAAAGPAACFFTMRVREPRSLPSEPDHESHWIPVGDVLDELADGPSVTAVRLALRHDARPGPG